MSSPRTQLGLVLLVHGCALGLQLFSFDNGTHLDEATYVAVSDELRWAHALTPTIEAVPVFFKPPLLYWVQAAAAQVLGRHLWAVRAPSLIATLGTALVLYFLLRRRIRLPHRVALLASSFFLSSFGVLRFGDLGMMDASFTFALLLAFAGAFQAARQPAWLLVSAVSVAAAILLKGPIGALLGGGFCAIALLSQRHRVKPAVLLASVLLMASLSLPWFVLEWRAFGDEFLDKFFFNEHLQKLEGHRTLGGEIFLILMPVIASLPWLPFGRPSRRGPLGCLP